MLLRAKMCSVIFFLANLKYTLSVGEKAFKACREYGQSMLECHNILYPTAKVRVPIDLLLYPHMVLIGFRKNSSIPPAWKCGGTLLSESWVLTAAHCTDDPYSGPASVLRLGTATFEFDEVEGLDQERNISNIIVHPGWKPPSKYHDVSLMRAKPHFILSRDIRIACLNLKEDIGTEKLTAIGFGSTMSGARTGSQTLMKVDVDVVDSPTCNKSVKFMIKRKILAQGITENQLCAGDYLHGGRDTCQGDSGGPLQIMEANADCVTTFPLHTIVGVTSFGRDCGRKYAPGVYTKVVKYVDWIESIVWPE